jgi:AcrR family transcriptional regulator
MSTTAQRRKRMSADARREVIEHAASEVFAERGYHLASIDEIARRSGVTAPVVYDHFESKQDLYKHLLERHLHELLELWREELAGDDPAEQRIPRALDAWFRYIEEHPSWLLVFRDAPAELADFHRQLRAEGLGSLVPLLAREPGAENLARAADPNALAMATELFRYAVAGVALWWSEHRDVPREEAIATIMNMLWIGFDRVSRGERWQPRTR